MNAIKCPAISLRRIFPAVLSASYLVLAVTAFALPDLRVTMTATPSPVSVGELLNYQLTVTNRGDATAGNVTLTSLLSSNATVFSVTVSQGSFTQDVSAVGCQLGSLGTGAVATVRIAVTPQSLGTVTNSSAVSETEPDAEPADNAVVQTTLVVPLTTYAGPNLRIERAYHTATLLLDGRLLIAGGNTSTGTTATAELYDPQAGTFSLTADMREARGGHTATLLLDGTVLIAGGSDSQTGHTAEIFDPTNGTFTSVGEMIYGHIGGTAARLADGRVLIVGDYFNTPYGVDLYLPEQRIFTNAGSISTGTVFANSVLLNNGKVLVAGGRTDYGLGAMCELYDPVAATFTSVSPLAVKRLSFGLAKLTDGRVLMVGGTSSRLAEIYDPLANQILVTNQMLAIHDPAQAVRLLNGGVLVTGADTSPEVYDPANASFRRAVDLLAARAGHTASLLPDGSVLIAGGQTNFISVATTELYDPARTKPPPAFSVSGVTVVEGDAGTTNASFVVTLSSPMGVPTSVSFFAAGFTASAGRDFTPTNGVLAFSPGQTNQSVAVAVIGNRKHEPTKLFSLELTNPVNAVIAVPSGQCTILNDDPFPAISISDVSVLEGNSGTTSMVFQVTLLNSSTSEVRVVCATTNGAALAGFDYGSTTTTLIFPSGSTNQPFSVPILGDSNNESNETFFVNLSTPLNGVIARGIATGTIINDDAAPGKLLRFTIDPVSSPQYRGRALPLTVRALDHLDQPATLFNGLATLAARTDQFYTQRLFDDFEDGDLAGWSNFAGGSQFPANVNDVAAVGVRSLRLDGRAQAATTAYVFRRQLTNSRPNRVSFRVRAAQTNAITGRFWLWGNPVYRAVEFYLNNNARMGLNSTNGFVGVPYESNRWYAVDLDLDWASQRVNCRVDGALVITNTRFPDIVSSGADYVGVQNTDYGTSWFDEIHVFQSYSSNLVVTPTTLGGFSGGVWTGNVTVNQTATNAYFTVTDGAEHNGQSTNFDLRIAPLQLLTPAAITEGSAPVAAEVRIPVAFSQALTVYLTSSVPAELTVPLSVTIPAGQTNASFNLTVIDDALLDGTQIVKFSAGNTNLVSTTNTISVDDNEMAVLTLSVPTNVTENAGTLGGQASVTVSATVAKATAITLASSDTNLLQVPASVTIPANQSSANFNLSIMDDSRIDGTQFATVTTSAANWTNDSKLITITDNEDTQLRFSGPAQVSEEAGSASYTALISGALTTNLTLAFASDNTNALVVPASAVILAGQTSVAFSASVVDNALFDGAKVVTLSASAPDFLTGSNSVTVLDNEIHHLGFAAISGVKTSSVPFNVTLTARDILDNPATAFNGPVALTASGPAGASLIQPTSVTLANGSWSGAITLFTTDGPITLQAASTTGLTGQSNPFQVSVLNYFTPNFGGGDLVYSPISQRIWVLVGSNNTLVPIEPFRSFVEPAVSAGAGAGRIVTSGDGRYLHIVGNSGLAVRRFDTLTRAVDLTWTNSDLSVEDIAAQPGNPNLVAVSWACPGCSPRGRGVTLYEGGVARSNLFGVNLIEFGESPDRLYGYNNDVYGVSFRTARVDASGLVDEGTLPIMGWWGDNFLISGGTLFSQSGGAFDPDTAVMYASANGWWGGQGDRASGRFCTVGYYTIGPVSAFDLATMLPVGSVNIPGPYNITAITRWSSNGLAFAASGRMVVLRSTLLPSAPVTDLAVTAAQTNVFVLSSNTVHCPLTIANSGPNPATNAVLAVLLPANVTLSGVTCANGIVQSQSVSSVVCVVTNLAVGATALVDLTVLGGLPGAASTRVSLTGDNADLNRTNNLLTLNFQVGYAFPPDSVIEMLQPSLDLAWNSNAGRIVISAHNIPLNAGSSLLVLDPMTGRFDAPAPIGRGPNHLSIHPAGRYVYAGLDGESAITRVDLASRLADLKFTPPHPATDLAAKPDDPAVVVATVSSWPQVLVYRNGVQLPNTVDPGAYLWDRYIEFSTVSPDLLYLAEVDGFTRVQIDTNGATALNGVGGMISGYDRDKRCSGGRVFTAGGRVFDPETGTFIGTVPYSGLVAPDVNSGRAFYLSGSGTNYTLTSVNFTNLQFIGSLTISNISGTPSSLIRWGADGLAFRTTGGQIFLIRTALADDRDNDGLADTWELAQFGSLSAPNGGPNDDPDHDGFTNQQEYQAGLSPLAFDAVGFLSARRVANGSFEMSVLGHLSQSYALLSSTNLTSWETNQFFACPRGQAFLADTNSAALDRRYYRFVPASNP